MSLASFKVSVSWVNIYDEFSFLINIEIQLQYKILQIDEKVQIDPSFYCRTRHHGGASPDGR